VKEYNLEIGSERRQLLRGHHTDYVIFDGESYSIVSSRNEPTVRGTTWRFLSGSERTLMLLPVQTSKLRPANPGVVAGDVSSVLSGLASLAYDVMGAYSPQENTKDYYGVPLSEWTEYARHKLTKRDKAAECMALEIIQNRSVRWNGKKLPKAQARELRDVLFNVAIRYANYPNCKDDDLRYALTLWRERTGNNPRENIILDYSEDMPNVIEELVQRVVEAEGMAKEDARNLVMQQVSFVAEFGRVADSGPHHEFFVLLQSASFTVQNEEDVDLLNKVLPEYKEPRLPINEEAETNPIGQTKKQKEAAKNRRKVPEHKSKIVKYYKGLREERSKTESARLTRKWMARPKEAGGLGITGSELPGERQVMRWAGDAP